MTALDLAVVETAPRQTFIPREQFHLRSPARLILETDIGELLAAVVAHDRAGVQFGE